MSDPYSPEAAALYNASIVGARLEGCQLHAMVILTACIGIIPPFTCAMWKKHMFMARAQAFFKHEDQLWLYKRDRRKVESTKLERR